jgi:MFS family permease
MNIGASFLFFLLSTTLGTVALHCVRFGVSWLVLRETGSAVSFAIIFSISSLVEVYSKPVLSPMADYFDRLKVYRACVGLASLTALILLLIITLLPFSVWAITGLLMLLSLIAGLRDPTSAGLVPVLVTANRMTEAQSLRSTVSSVVGLAAPMFSALLLAVGGISAALTVAAAVSGLALASTFGVRLIRSDVMAVPRQWSVYIKTWHLRTADGVRAVLMTRSERKMALVVAITNAGLFPFFSVVLPLWVARGLNSSAGMMAVIEVSFSIGILIGSVLLISRANKMMGRFNVVVFGNGLLGVGLVAAAFVTNPVGLAVCFAIGGAGFAIFNINASTLRAAATPPAFRSRMAAGVAFLSSCLNPFATQGIGFVIESSSASTAVAVCGTLILVSTLLLRQNSDAKSLLMRSDQDIVAAYATLYPMAFVERQQSVSA